MYHLGVPGHLATITSEDENIFIINLGPVKYFWLGRYHTPNIPDIDEPDLYWNWVTWEAWGYTYWNNDEPNNDYCGRPDRVGRPENECHDPENALIFWDDPVRWNDALTMSLQMGLLLSTNL
jgi:hypothetical protein